MTIKSIFESIVNFDLSSMFLFLFWIIGLGGIFYIYYFYYQETRRDFKNSSIYGKLGFVLVGIFLFCLIPNIIFMVVKYGFGFTQK